MNEFKIEEIDLEDLINNDGEVIKVFQNKFSFYYKVYMKNNNNKLVVFSNGAYDPSASELPVFMRSSWSDDIEANCLYIDDKTIHNNNLKIGWGVGTTDLHFLKVYVQFVRKIASLLNIEANSIMYYGSSAGGFMSMAMASYHKGTYAVVNNPQTYVYRYLKKSVTALYNNVFPGMSDKEVMKKYSSRLSLINIFSKNKNVPLIYYLQNRQCKNDMDNHVKPFLNNLDKYNMNSKNINLTLYNNKHAGHNPVKKNATVKFINSVLNSHLYLY